MRAFSGCDRCQLAARLECARDEPGRDRFERRVEFGKSSIARDLQDLLDRPWVHLGVDRLIGALAPWVTGDAPPGLGQAQLLSIDPDGSVRAGAGWERVQAAWYAGVACMARAGLGVIIEEVLLGGGEGQRRLSALLHGLSVLWVGVRCDPAVAALREAARGDRTAGMAAAQALEVHDRVRYDLTIDTSTTSTEECARAVLTHLRA